jgi:hypothetical protein
MDRSERNASYRYGTKVHCDCTPTCGKLVTLRTRNRHLERLETGLPVAALQDRASSEGESDVDMFTEPGELNAVNHTESLEDSEVANADFEPPTAPLNEIPEDVHDPVNSQFLEDARALDNRMEYLDDTQEELSEAPGTPQSWYNVGTPLPSPPQSPLALSDKELSEDEDGYVDVTADDYREYDRWYAEDCEPELDEFCTYRLSIQRYLRCSEHI